MGTGYIVSLIAVGVQIILILAVSIPFNRKYIVNENGKIDYKKTTVYLRWNVFDTVTIVVATYTILCTLLLFFLLANGEDIENAWMQFLSNQAQAWVIVTVSYFISRISMTLKSIKAHLEDKKDEV